MLRIFVLTMYAQFVSKELPGFKCTEIVIAGEGTNYSNLPIVRRST